MTHALSQVLETVSVTTVLSGVGSQGPLVFEPQKGHPQVCDS